MRLFVSVDLPDTVADQIADLQEDLADASGITPTDPTQAHVTLTFLGDVDPSRVDAVIEAIERGVERAAVDPFAVSVEGIGVFPDIDYISTVWLGIADGTQQLTRLNEAIKSETMDLGFESDDHEFTPHVTIARMKHAGGKAHVQDCVREWDPVIGQFQVDAVHLTESELQDSGPEYTTVEAFPLD